MKKDDLEYVIIAGCSRFGANIATVLSLSGKDVIIIDLDEDSFRKLSQDYSGFKLIGDATDIDVLINAGINKATMLVAATNDDDVNIMISQISKVIFNTKKVISRLYDDDKEVVYKDFNITLLRPTSLTINEFERLLCIKETSNKNNNSFKSIKNDKISSFIRKVGAY